MFFTLFVVKRPFRLLRKSQTHYLRRPHSLPFRPFEKGRQTDEIGIMSREAVWEALPPMVPQAVVPHNSPSAFATCAGDRAVRQLAFGATHGIGVIADEAKAMEEKNA